MTWMRRGVVGPFTPSPLPDQVPATGRVHEVTLTAAPTTLPLLDGRGLDVWAYNGRVPGPTLRASVGDTLRVRLTNALPQPTTIHWHGIRLPNGMDGVPGVTQPPVAPGESFVYEFPLKDAGLFWFHPHLRGSEQLERGLYGLLIVDAPEPPPFSTELVWVLDDWRLDGSGQVDPRFNTRGDLAHDGRWGQVLTVNGEQQPVVRVRPGERVRLRMVNVANGRIFAPVLVGLDARLIAFDALPTDRPLPAEGLVLAPGNRADLDLTVPTSLAGHSVRVVDRFGGRQERVLAELEVAGEEVAPRRDPRPHTAAPVQLAPVHALAPVETFRLDARAGGPYGIEWTINGEAFRHEEGHGGGGAHGRRYRLPTRQWARLRFVNDSFRLHPMHVHGQFFRVLTRNGVPAEEGHWRDTVLLRPKETVDVAMFPQDEGVWMLHCHIQEHAESGMMTLVEVPE